jgi:hypothetical protein
MPKKNRNDLRDVIAACDCVTCRALTSLKVDAGANILISRTNTGRMCEMAVVAAAGAGGLTGDEVVEHREAYARHLGVELPAGTRNRPEPFHIAYAIEYSNHTMPGQSDRQPFNLGRAHASYAGGRYFLLWDAAPVSGQVDAPLAVNASAYGRRAGTVKHGIEIAWSEGIERIELDLRNVGLQTVVTDTVQHIDKPAPGYPARYLYNTTSSVAAESDGAFRLTIGYASKDNKHIRKNDSWWGITTIVLRPGGTAGMVEWTHAGANASSGEYTFCAATWRDDEEDVENDDADEGEHARRADETEIEGRTDLTPTQKNQMIKARRGQGRFRAWVLRKEPRCRVTGIDDPAHLRASHIKAWAACDNDADRLNGNNGLMLAPHVDHLFDKAYISFHDDGTLLVMRDPAVEALLKAWGIDQAALVPRPFNARQRAFLAEHRERLTRRQGG